MPADLTPDDIVRLFDLTPLEGEGGFFRRTWFRPSDTSDRPEASCILYLITPDSFSALHRLRHDEIFHFYLGDPCRSIILSPEGELYETLLGQDVRAGMQVQHRVPAGVWQATRLVDGGRFALLGTTMSPGFYPGGFELATRAILRHLAPGVQEVIDSVLPEEARLGEHPIHDTKIH